MHLGSLESYVQIERLDRSIDRSPDWRTLFASLRRESARNSRIGNAAIERRYVVVLCPLCLLVCLFSFIRVYPSIPSPSFSLSLSLTLSVFIFPSFARTFLCENLVASERYVHLEQATTAD